MFPSAVKSPVTLASPATYSLDDGLVDPMPTFPEALTWRTSLDPWRMEIVWETGLRRTRGLPFAELTRNVSLFPVPSRLRSAPNTPKLVMPSLIVNAGPDELVSTKRPVAPLD